MAHAGKNTVLEALQRSSHILPHRKGRPLIYAEVGMDTRRAMAELGIEAGVALAFHPREALPNSLALARAETLFVELVGHERARLGAALATFRAALEAQDPAAIQNQREYLARVTFELSPRSAD